MTVGLDSVRVRRLLLLTLGLILSSVPIPFVIRMM